MLAGIPRVEVDQWQGVGLLVVRKATVAGVRNRGLCGNCRSKPRE